MKIIRVSSNSFESMTKSASYKVTYKRKYDPMGEESKTLNIDSPERAIEYIKKIIGKDVEIIGVEEVRKSPTPTTVSPKTTPRERTVSPRTSKDTPPVPRPTGFRVNFYPDYNAQGEMQSKVYQVASFDEAIKAFKEEFPNGIMEGRPIDLHRNVEKGKYDENGKPTNREERQAWWDQMKMQNRPRENYLK